MATLEMNKATETVIDLIDAPCKDVNAFMATLTARCAFNENSVHSFFDLFAL